MSERTPDQSGQSSDRDNVIDISRYRSTGNNNKENRHARIIRLAPELDGLEILYSNDTNRDKMYSMRILCWALRENGMVDAMIPWLSKLVPAVDLDDPLNGHWEGYYDAKGQRLFYDPPPHKVIELEGAASYFYGADDNGKLQTPAINQQNPNVLQELPDNIGTHAILSENAFKTVTLSQITSWRLMSDGQLLAMIADNQKVDCTPVLPGDICLYPVQERDDFKYFFHHVIANKIKSGDPEAIDAFSKLLDK